MRKNVANGMWTSRYRDRDAIMKAKLEKGGNSAATWFLKGETTCTTTSMATPGSALLSEIKTSLSKDRQADRGKTLVVEDKGLPVTLGLRVRDLFRREGCTFGDAE